MTSATYEPKHRAGTDPGRLLTLYREHPAALSGPTPDFPSLADDPPPVHPTGLVVGKRRRFVDETAERVLRALRPVRDERGSTTLGVAVACFMFALVMIGVGSFMMMLQEASLR